MPEQSKTPIGDRLTFVGNIYHSQMGEQPTAVPMSFTRQLATSEQPYERKKVSVGEEWAPLDFGYLNGKPISCFTIENLKEVYQTIPTPEVKAADLAKVLEIAYESDTEAFLVPVGELHPFYPSDASKLRIRSQKGTAKYSLVVFPG